MDNAPKKGTGYPRVRSQAETFQAQVRRCAEDRVYEQVLLLVKKHRNALFDALAFFIRGVLRALQRHGDCLPEDARYILSLTRPKQHVQTVRSDADTNTDDPHTVMAQQPGRHPRGAQSAAG